LGSCPMVGFGFSGAEPSEPATIEYTVSGFCKNKVVHSFDVKRK
jgi:hypothetical protein